MPTRLDNQKRPATGRRHSRLNQRPYVRGYSQNPNPTWGDAQRGNGTPGSIYLAEPTVTASDGTNAGKLAGLGYVANPTTNWTTGQAIFIGGLAFNWQAGAWAPGIHA